MCFYKEGQSKEIRKSLLCLLFAASLGFVLFFGTGRNLVKKAELLFFHLLCLHFFFPNFDQFKKSQLQMLHLQNRVALQTKHAPKKLASSSAPPSSAQLMTPSTPAMISSSTHVPIGSSEARCQTGSRAGGR